MTKNKLEKTILLIFIAVNIALYLFSYDGATFLEGADASQYLYPAYSIIEYGGLLSSSGDLLTFGPPLYSFFLSVPIYIFGFEESSGVIVFVQCLLLYLTGYLSKYILFRFTSKYSILLQSLIIFNPNSLITAHLVQTETLFTFLFVLSLILAFRLIECFSLKNLILLGFITGLTALTRTVAIYLLIAWPIFILTSLLIKEVPNVGSRFVFNSKDQLVKLLLVTIIGGLVISPWYVRNYIEFNEVFFSKNAGDYFEKQYLQLKNKGVGLSMLEAHNEHDAIFLEYLEKENDSIFCFDNRALWSCSDVLARASLSGLVNEPFAAHIKALTDSWATLFLAGGASNIRNYLGFKGKSLIVNFQNNKFNGFKSIIKLIKDMNFSYFFIFIFTTIFSVFTRVVGFIGLFYMIKEKEWRPYAILLVEVVSIFTAAYLYLGQSRFRVPLEPILMLFTVVGFLYIVKRRD